MEERLRLANADGLILSAVYTPPPAPTGRAVVLCHGLSDDKDAGGLFADLAGRLAGAGLAVFRFDFRGHGESEGDPALITVTGGVRDLEAAVAHLKARGHGRFGLVGASFGAGPVAFHAARNADDVGSLVLWNPLIDYADWRGRRAPGDPEPGSGLAAEIDFLEPWKELLPLTIPMLFLHGDHDRIVPHASSAKYAPRMQAAELITITGADHGFQSAPEHAERAVAAAVEFLRQTL